MKSLISFLLLLFSYFTMTAQQIAIAVDQENVLYTGLENSITIAAENCACNKLVVKVSNGTVSGSSCKYVFKGNQPGRVDITVFRKTGSGLKKLGVSSFRVKRIPAPVFCIGPYGEYNKNEVNHTVLAAQMFARAQIECCGFDARAAIDSFHVQLLLTDSCKVKYYFNETGELSKEITNAFAALRQNDIVIFDRIYAKGPDGLQWELDPLFLRVKY